MEQLKLLREKRNLLQRDVAKAIGVDRTTYVKYERGKSEPSYELLKALADFYGVTIDFLLDRDNEKKPDTMTGAELDNELVKLLCSVPPDQVQRVKDFVAGMIAAREKPLSKESDESIGQADSSPHPTKD